MAGEYLIKRYGVKLDDDDEEFDLSKRDKKPMIFKAPTLTGGSASSIKKPVLNQPTMADFKKLDYAQSKDLKPAQNLAKSRGMFGTLGKTVPTPTLMTGTAKRAQDSRKEYENAMIFASPDEARQIRQNYEKQRQNQLNLITPMLTNQRAQRQILPQLPKDFKKQLSKDLSAQIPQREFGAATEEFMNDLNAQLEADMGLREQPVTRQSISQAEENLMALQRQSVPFAATSGFVKSMADLPAVMIPFTPEQRAQYNAPFAQTAELHPLAYGAGQFAGEAIKYGTAAKMVEGMPVLQEALGRFGGKVSSALGGKVSAEVISRLAAGRISDLPLDVIYAAQETDNPQDFAKNLGINTAMGLGTDVGLETIGKLWRMGKTAAASNAPGGENWYNRKMDELKDPFGVAPETKPGYNQGGGDLSGQRGSRSEGSVGNFGEGGLSQSSAVDTGRTRAGGQADGIDSEILRRKWELDTAETEIIRAGKTEYRIKKVPEAQISPIAKETQQILSEYGVPATISGEPVIARNGERFVQTGEGSTIGTGRVLIQNDHGFTPKNMGNHEALHASKFLYPDIHEAVETAITDGGIRVIKDGKINPVLQLIIDKYSKTHPNIDSISDQRELINEIAAQIAGLNAIDPDFTREKFGDILYDYDGALSAIQNALDEMKRRTGRSGAAGGNTRFTPLPEVKRPTLPESDPILQSRNWEKPKVEEPALNGYGKNTVGAAESGGRMTNAQLVEEYGALPKGEQPRAREGELPKETREGKTARFARTAYESQAVTDEAAESIARGVNEGSFAYPPVSDARAINYANDVIETDGLEAAFARFDELMNHRAAFTKEDVALGERLIQEASKAGDNERVAKMTADLALVFTQNGQVVQAARMFKRLTPEGRLMMLNRLVNRQNVELRNKRITPRDHAKAEAAQVELDGLLKDISSADNRLKQAENDFKVAKEAKKVADAEKAFTSAKEPFESAQSKLNDLRAQKEALQRQKNSLKGKTATAEKWAAKNAEKIKTLRESLESAQKEYDAAKELFEHTRKQREETAKAYKSLVSQTGSFKRREYQDWWKTQLVNEKILQTQKEYDAAKSAFDAMREKRNRVEQLKSFIDKINGEIKIPQENIDDILSQNTPEGLEAAYNRALAAIGKQIPASMKEKFIEFTHIAMLSGPKTHIKNVLANAAMLPQAKIANKVSAIGQNLYKLGDKGYQPTQALFVSKESKDIAHEIYNQVKDAIGQNASGKFRDKNVIMQNRQIFDTHWWSLSNLVNLALPENKKLSKPVMEYVRNGIYNLLDLGDTPFVKMNFEDRLASFIEARGIKSAADVPQEAVEAATEAALKATFKDDNAITKTLQNFKKNFGSAGEMLFPFTKTPANILAREIDYSPVGLAGGVRKWVKEGGDPSKYIDTISQGLTGSGVILLGYLLAKAGIITGELSQNKRKAAFERQQGKSAYALKVNGRYYTHDWAQPASANLIIGAVINDAVKDGNIDDLSLGDLILKGIYAAGDSILEMSMFQNVQDVMGGYGSPSENLVQGFVEIPQRLIPSGLGAITRGTDNVYRNAYSKGNTLETQLNTAKSKIPGLAQNLPISYDTWGNPRRRAESGIENAALQFIMPWNSNPDASTELDKEVMRLYDATKEESVFPRKADWTVSGKDMSGNAFDKDLTNREYSQYQQQIGEQSYNLVEGIFDSDAYALADDETRAKMLQDAYDYANATVKMEMFNIAMSKENQKIYRAQQEGIPISDYIAYKNAFSDLEGGTKEIEKQKENMLLRDGSLSDEQKNLMGEFLFNDVTVIPKDIIRDFSSNEALGLSKLSDAQKEKYAKYKEEKLDGTLWGGIRVSEQDFVKILEITRGYKKKEDKKKALEAAGYSAIEANQIYNQLLK